VNILFGGYMFTSLTAKYNKKVLLLFDKVEFGMLRDNTTIVAYPDISHIHSAYRKRKMAVCHQLEYDLMRSYPACYYRINSLLKDLRI
jgi:hypothetical protein